MSDFDDRFIRRLMNAVESSSHHFSNLMLLDDPEPETKWNKNWCDMPAEMKEEVIKYVDYKSSVQLRQTAHAEKNLVDSRKFDFEEVRLTMTVQSETEKIKVTITVPTGQKFTIYARKRFDRFQHGMRRFNYGQRDYRDNSEKYISVVANVLRVGNIKKLIVEKSTSWMNALSRVETIRAKILILNYVCGNHSQLELFLEKCEGMFETVAINWLCRCDCLPILMKKLALKTKQFVFPQRFDEEKCWEVIEAIKGMNAEIGTKFVFNMPAGFRLHFPGTRNEVPPNYQLSAGSSSKLVYVGCDPSAMLIRVDALADS